MPSPLSPASPSSFQSCFHAGLKFAKTFGQKIGFPALWMGLLVLPFMGWQGGLVLSAVIVLCRWMLRAGSIWILSDKFQAWLASLQIQYHLASKALSTTSQKRVAYVLVGLLVTIAPLGMNDYYLDVLTLSGIYVVLALGLNIVVGWAGLLDLGYIAFYAVGAYAYAIASTHWGVSFWLALPMGAALASLVGIFLGIITLRLRGDYLAIVTLGFLMIVHLILNNWDSVTNGPNGILGVQPPALGPWILSKPIHFYYLILTLVGLVIFVVHRLQQSRIGRAWMALREDEIAAASMGVPIVRMKILAFALGAGLAGLAGVFFAGRYSFVSPESFTFIETVFVLAMVVLGGMGSIPGVILGAMLLVILPELLRGFQDYRMLAFGGAMVLMMAIRPQGLIGNSRRHVSLGHED